MWCKYYAKKFKTTSYRIKNSIKHHQKEIDNPALVIGIVSELSFFIDNLEEDEK